MNCPRCQRPLVHTAYGTAEVDQCTECQGTLVAQRYLVPFLEDITKEMRKVIGFEDATSIERGDLLGAYNLDGDPGEHRSVHADAAWPRKLYARVGAAAAQLLIPVVGTEAAGLDPEKQAELRAMGYGGGE